MAAGARFPPEPRAQAGRRNRSRCSLAGNGCEAGGRVEDAGLAGGGAGAFTVCVRRFTEQSSRRAASE